METNRGDAAAATWHDSAETPRPRRGDVSSRPAPASGTSHAWLLDVDFWPGADSRKLLEAAAAEAFREERTALVAPAFDAIFRSEKYRWGKREAVDDDIPRSLDDLLRCLARTVGGRARRALSNETACTPFHHHGSTRYVSWLAASALRPEQTTARVPCFTGDFYEPFVVVPSCASPPPPAFDERFEGPRRPRGRI